MADTRRQTPEGYLTMAEARAPNPFIQPTKKQLGVSKVTHGGGGGGGGDGKGRRGGGGGSFDDLPGPARRRGIQAPERGRGDVDKRMGRPATATNKESRWDHLHGHDPPAAGRRQILAGGRKDIPDGEDQKFPASGDMCGWMAPPNQ